MSNNLFDDFNEVSAKQWKQKIQYELQGEDYNALLWQTNESILVKPFYHAEDLKNLPQPQNTKATKWKIGQTIYVADTKISNKNALFAIKNGVESLAFIIPSETVSIENLLKGINLETIEIHFKPLFLSHTFLEKYPQKKNIFIHNDIIGNLGKSGNWFQNSKHDINTFKKIYSVTNTLSVDAALYQNAGANIVQQLAYSLAHANEYLNILNEDGLLTTKTEVVFQFAIDSNYFFEIAKLRAIRLLWKSLAPTYNLSTNCEIIVLPTLRNKTIYENYNNLLRTTTECMSGILGGANTVFNIPYNTVTKNNNAFNERIARNQLLILKHESHFNTVNNPVDGSYYIETITNQLAEKALNLFKDIEKSGGFLKQLKLGTIQRKIKASSNKTEQQLENNETILVGVNAHKYPVKDIGKNIQKYPFISLKPRLTKIESIIEKRVSENLERKRLYKKFKNEN
ncbi:methylmalonyl-CoA mutase [Tamlana sedimentorum]|uniref:Methylmalonyl-CoA mutase n=1 Tax=Neotamlana sedimentorum TaxID=1435349 RepID=A0A0D7WAM1_9FLAO|nr:methylmalonyl-CoA mutase subunit beta [Tamlana sedimentorum]KJD35718.1 methylmalonyl-CoA mutase [Tamlana sedimentorum]